MSNTPTDSRRAERASKALVIVLVGIFVLGMAGFALAVLDARGDDAAPPAPPSLPAVELAPRAPEAQAAPPRILLALADGGASPQPPSPSIRPIASADPAASPGPVPMVEVSTPVVPVAGFWSRKQGLRRSDVLAALESGKAKGFRRVVIETSIADVVATELGIELDEDVRLGDADKVASAVSKGALGPAGWRRPRAVHARIDA